ncbi:MAG: nuclease (SNase protein) [Humibacillus sp.]|nr:nuclease (SNase protein) [Humibacillus sp.]
MSARTTRTSLVLGALAALALTAAVAATGSGTPAAAPSGQSVTAIASPSPATTSDSASAAATWVVTTVVDGDTIRVSRQSVVLKIRIIGIDTPEVGECGYAEATDALRGIIGGHRVTLTAGARDDVDRYGRSLRYVDVDGVDAGLRLITRGYAVARYDSRDGYGRHAREGAYVRADERSPMAACSDPQGTTWPVAGDEHPCPQTRPVKGNEPSMIAHRPGQQSYLVTNPEQCFGSLAEAASAGFRPARR